MKLILLTGGIFNNFVVEVTHNIKTFSVVAQPHPEALFIPALRETCIYHSTGDKVWMDNGQVSGVVEVFHLSVSAVQLPPDQFHIV